MRPIRPSATDRGFTLIELMIAMMIIAVGILATMAMQFSALAGYNGARNTTGATEMARSVEHAIQAEARDWETGQNVGSAGTESPYSDMPDYFSEAIGGGGNWVQPDAVDEPVTLRHNRGTTENAGDDGANRYCVYVAGEGVEDDFARIAIAVVYPAPNSSFAEWDFECPGTGEINLNTSNREDLELDGLRSTHLSTAVQASPSDNR